MIWQVRLVALLPTLLVSILPLSKASVLFAYPLTSVKSSHRTIYPNEVLIPASTAGLKADSVALCYQVRTLSKTRLRQDLGVVADKQLIQAIHKVLRFQLDL